MAQQRFVEHQAVFKGTSGQFGIFDGGAVITASNGTGFKELSEFGKFFSFAVLADATDYIDVAIFASGGLLLYEFDGRLRINRRHRIGTAGDGRKSTVNGGPCTGFDGFILFVSRLAEMNMHIDESRQYDFTGSVENVIAIARRRIDFDNFAIMNT
jgi:hypothetical protein